MSNLEEKLENILGNPQAMEQIMSLAQSLGGGSSAPSPPPEPTPQPQAPSVSGGLPDGLGQLDPRILSGIVRLMTQQNNDDGRVALLTALRPFVKEQRYAKVDKAIQIAKLSRLIRTALTLFRTREDSDV